MSHNHLQLSLGPILFFWPKADVQAFYQNALDWPVKTVYLGEVVCSRRQELRFQDWFDLACQLDEAGKEVILSCHALIESESDLKRLRKIAQNGRFKLEANDLGAVKMAQENQLSFVAGPHLNIYNPETLALYQSLGAFRWLPPVEMGETMLASILPNLNTIETEVFAYGKLPLAFSARCFTARHYQLNKDDCQFKCMDHPDGLKLATREQQDFLTINGIQTMSHATHCLLPHLANLQAMGIHRLRISPDSQDTANIVKAFDQAIQNPSQLKQVMEQLPNELRQSWVDGYWHQQAGIDRVATGA